MTYIIGAHSAGNCIMFRQGKYGYTPYPEYALKFDDLDEAIKFASKVEVKYRFAVIDHEDKTGPIGWTVWDYEEILHALSEFKTVTPKLIRESGFNPLRWSLHD